MDEVSDFETYSPQGGRMTLLMTTREWQRRRGIATPTTELRWAAVDARSDALARIAQFDRARSAITGVAQALRGLTETMRRGRTAFEHIGASLFAEVPR